MNRKLISKICLGTAQFGLDYGINNKSGKISNRNAKEIMTYAFDNGINFIDTAYNYGNSESIIGEFSLRNKFNIISKIPSCDKREVDIYISKILSNLRITHLYAILLHCFKTYKSDIKIYSKLNEYRDVIKKIGFSIYYTEELDYLISENIKFDIIQLPYNIFDRRFEKYFPILKSKDIEIHIRSIYLQGLIFKDINELGCHFNEFKEKLKKFNNIAYDLKVSKQELALNFCLENEYIDKIIIGVDNINHLKEAIISSEESVSVRKCIDNSKILCTKDESILLPFNWKL